MRIRAQSSLPLLEILDQGEDAYLFRQRGVYICAAHFENYHYLYVGSSTNCRHRLSQHVTTISHNHGSSFLREFVTSGNVKGNFEFAVMTVESGTMAELQHTEHCVAQSVLQWCKYKPVRCLNQRVYPIAGKFNPSATTERVLDLGVHTFTEGQL